MNKTILLTGATDGIGLKTAKALAADGHNLIAHGRSEEKLEELKNQLSKYNPNIKTVVADLSKLSDVKNMIDTILKMGVKLDVIINNAGVLISNVDVCENNLDIRFMVNTIAPYYLTKGLLQTLNDNSRIVNLSSAAQAPIDWEVFNCGGAIDAYAAYAQSKLAITMWTISLAERLQGKSVVVAVNPKSLLGSKMVKMAYGQQGYDLEIGADILLRAALSKEFANANGRYFDNDRGIFSEPHVFAQNRANREMLIKIMDQIISK